MTSAVRLEFVSEVIGPVGEQLAAFDVAPTGDLVTVWQAPRPSPFPGGGLTSTPVSSLSEEQRAAVGALELRRRSEVEDQTATVRVLDVRTREYTDTRIVSGFEVEHVAASDSYVVLVGTDWDRDATAVLYDVETGSVRRGLLGWDITDVARRDRGGIWIGYGDQACYSGPPTGSPEDVAKAMDSGLALFSLDFELLWNLEARWNGSPHGIEDAYFVHADGDDGVVVWDGLGDTLNFVDSERRVRQLEWDSELLSLVGVLRAEESFWLLAIEDCEQLMLIEGSPRGAAFTVAWCEQVEVPPSEDLWRSEHWRTRDGRVDLVLNGSWFAASLDQLLAQRR